MKRLVALILKICSFALILGSVPQAIADEHIVYWNSTNVMFRNRHPTIEVKMGDVVRFVCPDNERRVDGEYLIVYEVTEFAMADCALESHSREVINCGPELTADKLLRAQQLASRGGGIKNQKIQPKNVAQLIRQLNPIPNGKEYQPGQTYYYITTSKGKESGLNQRVYGLCESKNMRLSMKVTASQPAAHPVKPMSPTRRQEDFVTKSSAEIMNGQEDEDSENDNAHLLPRDLIVATNPKFRRPSQLESAGVENQQFMKVVQMAQEGKTGTFENERNAQKSAEKEGWHPVNVQYMADLMNNAYQNADERISYQTDFEIHEENELAVKSLEYSSSTPSLSIISSFFIVIVFLF